MNANATLVITISERVQLEQIAKTLTNVQLQVRPPLRVMIMNFAKILLAVTVVDVCMERFQMFGSDYTEYFFRGVLHSKIEI